MMPRPPSSLTVTLLVCALACALVGCQSRVKPGQPLVRTGDEIMIAGQLFHTRTPVVLWFDPGGYDAYRTEMRTTPGATTRQSFEHRPTGDSFESLQQNVDQLVYHYDVSGLSRLCFATLHDNRGLSCHFLIDIDGTVYQTLDLKERAWHATTSNSRSVGIEIANRGAYASPDVAALQDWYPLDANGSARIAIPPALGDGGVRTRGFVGRPDREHMVTGAIHGRVMYQYDFTPQQYDALIKLTATLCTVLPKITCDFPRDEFGNPLTRKLEDHQLAAYRGILGHYHVQENKQDPGPAFQWELVVGGARNLMRNGG